MGDIMSTLKKLSTSFLKFVVHKINSEIVKSEMVVLTGRED
jgi:hypothetical protein